jgi:hypothetical protein
MVALTIALLIGFREELVGLFVGPDDPLRPVIVLLGAQLLIVAAVFQLADAAQVMALGLLRGRAGHAYPDDLRGRQLLAGRHAVCLCLRLHAGLGRAGHLVGPGRGIDAGGRVHDLAVLVGACAKSGVHDVAADLATRACRSYPVTRCVLGSSRVFRYLIAFLVSSLALPALAQDLPNLREARGLVFAEDGAVSWEVIADPALTEADLVTLDQINQVQPQPYYAALALAPDAGLASEIHGAGGELP